MTLIDKLFRRRTPAAPKTTESPRYPAGLPVPLLAELILLISEITAEDLARTENSLKPPSGEKVIGSVAGTETTRLWALHHKCSGRALAAKHRAEFECSDSDDAAQARHEYERWRDLSALMTWMFWIQAKDDIGDPAWAADVAGKQFDVRAGYRIVAMEQQNPMARFMGSLGGV